MRRKKQKGGKQEAEVKERENVGRGNWYRKRSKKVGKGGGEEAEREGKKINGKRWEEIDQRNKKEAWYTKNLREREKWGRGREY